MGVLILKLIKEDYFRFFMEVKWRIVYAEKVVLNVLVMAFRGLNQDYLCSFQSLYIQFNIKSDITFKLIN